MCLENKKNINFHYFIGLFSKFRRVENVYFFQYVRLQCVIWSFYCIFGRLFAYIRHRHLIVRPPYVIGSERNEVSSYRSLAGCLKIVNPLWVFEICSNKKWNSEWLSSSKMVDDVKNITETAESKGICAIIVETCHYSVNVIEIV